MSEEAHVPDDLLLPEAARIAERYRVSQADALAGLREAFEARPALAKRIADRLAEEDVTRWREFRDVVRRCRRRLYYDLRRYYADPERAGALVAELEARCGEGTSVADVHPLVTGLLECHVSTRERLPHYEEFYTRLFELAGVPRSIVDVGCGMHPLSYPFAAEGKGTERYLALDGDGTAIRAVRAFSRLLPAGRLRAVHEQIGTVGDQAFEWGPAFDLALLLKIVPVVARLDRQAASALHGCPARRALVTGNAESMTKRQSVERRERRALERFVAESGRRVIAEFDVGGEFGFLIE
jgi:hypothetical protein